MELDMKPNSVIKADLGIQKNGPVHAFFTATCALHMDKYVPFRSGDLASTVVENGVTTSNVKENMIVYEQPYACYQYYGIRKDGTHEIKNHTTDMHDLATTYWDKYMWSAEQYDVIEEVQKALNKGVL